MKTRSILSSVLGSVLFASAVTMLLPNLASATFQDAGSPPRVSQAVSPDASPAAYLIGKHLSAQQMQATKGADGAYYVCLGDCNNGINGCGPSSLYGGSTCVSIYNHHKVCVFGSYLSYSYCTEQQNLDCYDYQYWSGGCGIGTQYPTVPHMQMCCGL